MARTGSNTSGRGSGRTTQQSRSRKSTSSNGLIYNAQGIPVAYARYKDTISYNATNGSYSVSTRQVGKKKPISEYPGPRG